MAQSAEAFANAAKKALAKDSSGPLPVFVCGNEAGDLDTIVSALAGAYAHSSGDPSNAIPLIPFVRCEFRLRGDAKMLFEHAGFQMDKEGAPEALTFWDDVDWAQVETRGGAGIMLTDHNKMSKALAARFSKVTCIIDHHADEGLYMDSKRTIDPTAGSACTLVAEELADTAKIPKDLGILLLGTILVDARNFDPKELRFNDRDVAQVKRLEEFMPEVAAANAEPKEWWFKKLFDARYDTAQFPAGDLLKLDYKEGEAGGVKIGFSAIFGDLETFVARAGSAEALHKIMSEFAESKSLAILLALTKEFEFEGEIWKSLIVVARGEGSEDVLSSVMQHLIEVPKSLPQALMEGDLFVKQGISSTGFGLVPHTIPEIAPLTVFRFRKAATRKTMLPTVMEFLKGRAAAL